LCSFLLAGRQEGALAGQRSDKESAMDREKVRWCVLGIVISLLLTSVVTAQTISEAYKGNIYQPGKLKPTDSVLKVKVGDPAPDFTLPSVSGEKMSLNQYRDKKNVVLSFVPAAWTPVCSDQWPGYNIIKGVFDEHDAVLLGITVDNIPTLFAWTNQMGKLWFPVLSDFWPHGDVAARYGILRSDGVTERALFVIDKKGTLRYIDVHDINKRPPLENLVRELEKIGK
jgi:peroxiredoxin